MLVADWFAITCPKKTGTLISDHAYNPGMTTRKQKPKSNSKRKRFHNLFPSAFRSTISRLRKLVTPALQIELECRKERNQQHYRFELERINKIRKGDRDEMLKKTQREETAVKERAKKMRTGRSAAYFLCF